MALGKPEEFPSFWPKNTVREERWLDFRMEAAAKDGAPRPWIWAVEAAINEEIRENNRRKLAGRIGIKMEWRKADYRELEKNWEEQ